jgi:bifunctional N-acetylglucosamine-1-phosphate-uridyltransferase/glucosamine-1-phosphate-acetyltransferase GlmU-like protein
MIPINSRMVVESFKDVVIAPQSKIQLEMGVEVIAPGETVVSAYITDKDGVEVVPEALLTLNSSVIDARVAWFTTGAAILLLLAGVAQSVRRVRKKSK